MVRLLDEFEKQISGTLQSPVVGTRGSPYLTVIEYTKLIAERAEQLERNFFPMIDVGDEIDPIKIAIKEFEMKRFPLLLHRHYPDGTVEDWDPNTMIFVK